MNSLHAELLDQLIDNAQKLAVLEAEKTRLLGEIEVQRELGHLDDKLQRDGWTFTRSPGRQSYDYPESVGLLEGQVQAAKEVAVATGAATLKPMKPFWTIRKPTAKAAKANTVAALNALLEAA